MDIINWNLPDTLDTLQIFPLSDLHVGEKSLDKKMFRDFVNYVAGTDNAYVILAGDLLNNAIVSSVSNTYEEEMTPSEQKKWLREELKPIKHKILAIVSGNHEYRSKKITDLSPIEDVCDFLDIGKLYRETEAYVKVTFGRQGRSGKKQMYGIYVTHGAGGGKRVGSALNNLELLAMSVEADIYICGHYHKKLAYKNSYRHVDLYHNKVDMRDRLFVVSSHWQEFGGYAAKFMLIPSAKGSVPVTLYADKKYFTALV